MEQKTLEEVRQKLTDYLVKKGLRRTSERYIILEEIYRQKGHFDIDTLYNLINAKEHIVSRATLYNTMEVLVEADLVSRHHFVSNVAFFEKCYNQQSHHHLICNVCDKVTEARDQIVQQAVKQKDFHGFEPTHYYLYVYGVCEACRVKEVEMTK